MVETSEGCYSLNCRLPLHFQKNLQKLNFGGFFIIFTPPIMHKRFFILLLRLLITSTTLAQKPFEVGVMNDYGFIFRHAPKIGHVQSHPWAVTAYFNRYHLGRCAWEQDFGYPQTSFAITYFNYQNPILGHSVALSANMLLPIYRANKSSLQFKIGTGLAFASKPFDIETNFQNNVLSNWWSYVMQGGFWWSYHINTHWKVKTGLQITHYSNGAFKLPNAGVNVITTFVGASYVFNPENIIFQKNTHTFFEKKWHFQTALAGSFIETEINQPYKHFVFNVGLYAMRDINRKHRLNAGLDFSWNEGIKYQIEQKFPNQTSKPDYRRISLVIGDEITFGDMSLNIQLGYYIRRQFEAKTDMPFYQRYGLKWYFHKNIFTGLLLKTHASVAECAEFTLGTHWNIKRNEREK